jgi:hypothetical protein
MVGHESTLSTLPFQVAVKSQTLQTRQAASPKERGGKSKKKQHRVSKMIFLADRYLCELQNIIEVVGVK